MATELPRLYLNAEEARDYDQYSEEELAQLLTQPTQQHTPPPTTLRRCESPLAGGDVPGTPEPDEEDGLQIEEESTTDE